MQPLGLIGDIPIQLWAGFWGAVVAGTAAALYRAVAKFRKHRRHERIRRDIVTLSNARGSLRVLEYGSSILINHGSIERVDDRFTLPIPLDTAKRLDAQEHFTGEMFHGLHVFGAESFEHLGGILQIEDIERKISPHIRQVAQQFEERQHGISFNSTLFGVRKVLRTRVGTDERPMLRLECFRTDYFTFKVMDLFHRYIREAEPDKSLTSYRDLPDLNTRLFPFLASVGLNFVLIGDDDRIVLSRRSSELDTFGQPGSPIYPTFNEGLASHDIPAQSGMQSFPSIPLCFARGLYEEVGIREEEVASPVYRLVGFGDIGIGFGVYGYARSRLISDEIINRMAGPDRAFEASEFFSVPMRRDALRAIQNNAETGLQVVALLKAMEVDFGL